MGLFPEIPLKIKKTSTLSKISRGIAILLGVLSDILLDISSDISLRIYLENPTKISSKNLPNFSKEKKLKNTKEFVHGFL